MDEKRNVENTENAPKSAPAKREGGLFAFLLNILRGAAIGVAFIIPGFSGGSVAAILGIYERLVGSITGLFKNFRQSALFLFPILIGMILGVAALVVPVKLGLERFPIPTVTLFVGLSLGGLPAVTEKWKGAKFGWQYALALLIPLAGAAALCFLPLAGEVDLLTLDAGGYLLLVVIGLVGSCALVVPGISGSMLLLIFGYYNPIVALVTEQMLKGMHLGTGFLVLALLAAGIVAGFFAISFLMRFLLKKFPRGSYYGICGFIVGSIPAVYVSTIRAAEPALSALYANPWYWVVTVLLFAVGFALSFLLVYFSKKKMKRTPENV